MKRQGQNRVSHQGQADFEVSGNGVKKVIRVVALDNIGDNIPRSPEIPSHTYQLSPRSTDLHCQCWRHWKHQTRLFWCLEWSTKPNSDENRYAHANQPQGKCQATESLSSKTSTEKVRGTSRGSHQGSHRKKGLRVSEVTDWCSPGFFVAKSDGRVRLVTDFTHTTLITQFIHSPPPGIYSKLSHMTLSISWKWMLSMATSTWLWPKKVHSSPLSYLYKESCGA